MRCCARSISRCAGSSRSSACAATSAVGSFVEVGPGRALAGMIKRIVNDVTISSVSDPASVRELLAA